MSVILGCKFHCIMMTTELTVFGITSGLGCHGHQEFGWSEKRTERDVEMLIDMYYDWVRSSLLVGSWYWCYWLLFLRKYVSRLFQVIFPFHSLKIIQLQNYFSQQEFNKTFFFFHLVYFLLFCFMNFHFLIIFEYSWDGFPALAILRYFFHFFKVPPLTYWWVAHPFSKVEHGPISSRSPFSWWIRKIQWKLQEVNGNNFDCWYFHQNVIWKVNLSVKTSLKILSICHFFFNWKPISQKFQ